ncbi:hypothetical protein [Pseudomonas sp. C11]|uniref:hypothetical protein n=1 Tax=Pseudomonas sp. C11 TaxID=3075550 RepID=UPI002AFFB306|nr:hypothetical protein [Pseudomonas sp. C11]
MFHYQAPLDEFDFVAHKVLRLPKLLSHLPEHRHVSPGLIRATLEVAAELAQELLNLSPPTLHERSAVEEGLANTYRVFHENGWPRLSRERAEGGLGFPRAACTFFNEMLASSNLAFSSLAKSREEIIECIQRSDDERVRTTYRTRLTNGEWLGTLCLREPQAGCNLERVSSTATLQMDGTYLLSGTKVAMVDCTQDMVENTVHLVLAREQECADTKPATLCLFAVPKYLESGELNGVSVSSLSPRTTGASDSTCTLQFQRAKGHLVGDLQRCIAVIRPKLCRTQLALGIQAVGLAETTYQNALRLTQDCYRVPELSWMVHPEPVARPALNSIDIKVSLAQLRLFIEPTRLLCTWVSTLLDLAEGASDLQNRGQASQLLEQLAPIVESYVLEESTKRIAAALPLASSISAEIRWGMERLVTESALSKIIYESSTRSQGLHSTAERSSPLTEMNGLALALRSQLQQHPAFEEQMASTLNRWVDEMEHLASHIQLTYELTRDLRSLITADSQQLMGTILFGYLWAWIATAAITSGEFSDSKPALARLYFSEAECLIPILVDRLRRCGARLSQLSQVKVC